MATMRSSFLAFFSPPASPAFPPAREPMVSQTSGSNIALFSHQDGKNFEVSIVRLADDDVTNSTTQSNSEGEYFSSPSESDWDSDDWDEDAEDFVEEQQPTRRPVNIRLSSRLSVPRALEAESKYRMNEAERRERRVDNWAGDVEDLEEEQRPALSRVDSMPVRGSRTDSISRRGDADVWRTRLGLD